jgi:hypothetical protein
MRAFHEFKNINRSMLELNIEHHTSTSVKIGGLEVLDMTSENWNISCRIFNLEKNETYLNSVNGEGRKRVVRMFYKRGRHEGIMRASYKWAQ